MGKEVSDTPVPVILNLNAGSYKYELQEKWCPDACQWDS